MGTSADEITGSIESLLNQAAAHHSAGELDKAEEHYNAVLRIDPENCNALFYIGFIRYSQGNFSEAELLMRTAINKMPNFPVFYLYYALLLKNLRRYSEAEAALKRAIDLNPGLTDAYHFLSSILVELGRFDEALETQLKATELAPNVAQGYNSLGTIYARCFRYEDAIKAYERALKLDPTCIDVYNNMGIVLKDQGKIKEALELLKKGMNIDNNNYTCYSNYFFTIEFDGDLDLKERAGEWKKWYKKFTGNINLSTKPHTNEPDPNRPLKIGYVSADFIKHSASSAFGCMITDFNRDAFEVICYSGVNTGDEITKTFMKEATRWRSTVGVSDVNLAKKIREDEIDILVDLSGHTSGNRLTMFAHKPAPVQVSAWGHAAGTGVPEIDYLFSNPILIPPEESEFYEEELFYLPNVIMYSPPKKIPDVNELPALKNNHITFGCFNRLGKISDECFSLWAKILLEIPGSRLVLKNCELSNETQQYRVKKILSENGVDEDRVDTIGNTTQLEHLRHFNMIDIALDPFPQGGGITTLDALWMGVPTVTLHGKILGGRITASIMDSASLEQFIAKTKDEYIKIACRQAEDLNNLALLRSGLRQAVEKSTLYASEDYVRIVEDAYRTIWKRWCDQQTKTKEI